MVGFEDTFGEQGEVSDGLIGTSMDEASDDKRDGDAQQARKILVPASQKRPRKADKKQTSDNHKKRFIDESQKRSRRDSLIEDNLSMPDATGGTNLPLLSSTNDIPHSPTADAKAAGRASTNPLVTTIDLLKECRDTNNWLNITSTSIRAFLDEHNEHQAYNSRKVDFVRIATEVMNREYPAAVVEDGDGGAKEKIVLEEQKRPKFKLKLKNPLFKKQ